MIEAIYLIKDGLCLYKTLFDPKAPDYDIMAGFISAISDFGQETTGKTLSAIKFEERDDLYASYLILERGEVLLLAFLVILRKDQVETEDGTIRKKMKYVLGEVEKTSSDDLNDGLIDAEKYSFVESYVYSTFFRDGFEQLNDSSFRRLIQNCDPKRILITLDKAWSKRYAFYRNDRFFHELLTNFSNSTFDALIHKMKDFNLFISMHDFSLYVEQQESMSSPKISAPHDHEKKLFPQKHTDFLAFTLKKGIFDIYYVHL